MSIDKENADALTRIILSIIIITILGATLVELFIYAVPATNRDAIMLIVGSLLTKFSDVVAYSFNTTAGSSKKDAIIKTQAETAKVAGAVLGSLSYPDNSITLAPGQEATAKATDSGTIITPNGDVHV